ncbi:hypothetical protein [Lysinibacillus sp. Bpr_S20]|uniref:hypothetical protein n=1 Tax=Lysinibacillus sp. Bpr_S20 TaxID=2933964 RepID=UPI002011CDBC|nr:hypothetical protein [Lysinibacillus sp. Bpr_S20]MCL1700807.1 hypothetical protein [Lysinibacillus sp. Bpr_S20]
MTNKVPMDTQYLLYKAQEHLTDYYQQVYEDFGKLKDVAKVRDENGFYNYVNEDFEKVMKDLEEVKSMVHRVMESKELNNLIREYLESDD